MDATFVVGEHSFARLGYASDASVVVEAFICLLEEAAVQGRVLAWEELFSAPVEGFESLSDFLFGINARLDRDLRILLGNSLDRLPVWDSSFGNPEYALTDGSSKVDFAPSVGLCLIAPTAEPWAVLCVAGGAFSGRCEVAPEGVEDRTPVWFLDEAVTLRDFWRDSLIRYNGTPADLSAAASYACPETIFAPNIWSQVGRFEGPWHHIRGLLIPVLAGLNDGIVPIFQEVNDNYERMARMSARHGVNCSPESPQTHGNAAAMKQREAHFPDGVRVCEWHAKLELRRNRVHFCVDGDTLYVGVFDQHLLV